MISFVYEWTDSGTGLRYIGRHTGELDDGYVGSGTVFKREYYSRPSDFVRVILWQSSSASSDEVKIKEDEFLSLIPYDQLYNGSNRKYYNQVKNSWGFTTTDNPMNDRDVVNKMIKTREKLGHKNVYENTISKYGEDGWREINSSTKIGNKSGAGNKGKPKSEEHKRKISESVKNKLITDKKVRKPPISFADTYRIWSELGTIKGAAYFNISIHTFRSRVKVAKKHLLKI